MPAAAGPTLSVQPARVRTVVGALLGLAVGACLALARGTDAFAGLEWRLVDVRTKHFLGQRAPDPGLVLAVVQNDDVRVLRDQDYPWPWPLDLTAHAFDWLRAAGARAVVVDVYQFDRGIEPEEMGLTDPESEAYKTQQGRTERADELAKAYGPDAARGAKGNVVLAFELTSNPPEAGAAAAALRRPPFEQRITRLPPLDLPPGARGHDVNLPVLRLLGACAGLGFANAATDGDGMVRRAAPVAEVAGRRVPALALAGMLAAFPEVTVTADGIRTPLGVQRVSEDGTFLVNFRGRTDAYRSVRAADLVLAGAELAELRAAGDHVTVPVAGQLTPDAVRGKIVLWGVNLSGVKDVVSTPVDANFPGPEYQLTVLDNILHGDGRVEAPRALNLALMASLAVVLGAVGAGARRRLVSPLASLLALAGVWVAGYGAFAAGTSFDLLTPSLAVLLTYAAVETHRALTEGRRNKWLESTFSQYLAPRVIEAIKKDPSLLALGGRPRPISVLFSDVKGFTTISEALSSEDTVRLLNDYLTRQSAPVLEADGVIDKFIGDAVMAFFGDPVPYEDHALRACRAALQSLRAVEGSQPLAVELGVGPIANRIGVASGPATVGNIGSDRRFNYTAIGDTVNFASRLEGANKAFGSRILLADATYQAAAAHVLCKPLARLVVVGKTEPVPVHELVALVEDATPEERRHVEAYRRAHAAVLADDLDAADAALEEALATRPGDGPSRWLGSLVDTLRAGIHPRPWDGVLKLDTK